MFGKLTKQEFDNLIKNISSQREYALAECDWTVSKTSMFVEHDPHLASLYAKQAEATRAIYDYVKLRKEGN